MGLLPQSATSRDDCGVNEFKRLAHTLLPVDIPYYMYTTLTGNNHRSAIQEERRCRQNKEIKNRKLWLLNKKAYVPGIMGL